MIDKEPTQEQIREWEEKIKSILTEVATQAVLICPDIPNEDYYTNQILTLLEQLKENGG